MSNSTIRALVDSADAASAGTTTVVRAEGNPGGTTTLVRADGLSGEDSPDLHQQLRAQLKELRLRTDAATPDLAMLLRLVSSHY
jgi:hypothetical protein